MFLKSCQIATISALVLGVFAPEVSVAEEKETHSFAFGTEYETYVLRIEGGFSRAHLPNYNFGVDIDTTTPGFPTGSRITTGEENLNGYQFGGGLYLPSMDIGGRDVVFGITGSYSDYDGDKSTVCDTALGNTQCNFFALFEVGPGSFDFIKNTFAGGIVFDADREVDLAEFAVKAKTLGPVSGTNVSMGVDYKRLSEDFDMVATGFEPGIPNTAVGLYNHELDTDYIGVFLGLDGAQNFADDFVVKFDGKVGVYRRDTEYNGRFFSDQRDFGAAPISQTLGLDDDDTTFIAEGKLEIVKMFGNTEVSGFVKGQWFSDVATVNYNDSNTAPVTVGGSQVGTTLGSEGAFTYTIGASVVMPF